MAKKKEGVPTKVPAVEATKAIIVSEVVLSTRQNGIVLAETPKAFIKTKPGRGGKQVSFVEGGYVIAKLNDAFSPFGWEFEVVEWGQTERKNEKSSEGEVWVKGKLTIVDHAHGFRVSKTQFGQHPIHTNVPMGDALKAAGTDSLKKCASMLGIALDVYWGQLDRTENTPPPKQDKNEIFERAKMMIGATKDADVLKQYDAKLAIGKTFSSQQKVELRKVVAERIKQLTTTDGKEAPKS